MLQIIEVIGKGNIKYIVELRTKNAETHSLLDDYFTLKYQTQVLNLMVLVSRKMKNQKQKLIK